MLTLNDIYALAGKSIALTEWVLRADWFPELGSVWQESSGVLDALAAAGRLTVTELINDYIDGRRIVTMHTLRLDGKPFMVVQNAGREGDDHRKRWVTDKEVFHQALSHLTVHMAETDGEVTDLVDPDAPLWVDEVLHFYGTDFSDRFGFKLPSRRTDVMLLRAQDVLPDASVNQVLAVSRKDSPGISRLIRRGGQVYQRVLAMTQEELAASNPQWLQVSEREGWAHVEMFEACPRPTTAEGLASVEAV